MTEEQFAEFQRLMSEIEFNPAPTGADRGPT